MAGKLTDDQVLTVHRWRKSGLSAERFVAHEGLGVSASTLRAWEDRITAEPGRPDFRGRESAIEADPELFDYALGKIAKHSTISAPKLRRKLVEHYGEERVPSARAVGRWRSRAEREHKVLLAYFRDPDFARRRYQSAVGSRSEDVLHPNQRWELDSTIADVRCADDRRWTLIGGIDVYTRRLGLWVAPTSSSCGIAAMLRRCILAWGVPDQVVTDQGSDYVSRRTRAALKRLEIDHWELPPGRPEMKPHIERVFGTVSQDLLEELQGYVGHSVAERQQIRERQRAEERRTRPLRVVEVGLTPEELQARLDVWCTREYELRPHEGLRGRSPQAVAEESLHPRRIVPERALDVLLAAPASGGGHRLVGSRGIKVEGAWFAAPELAEWIGQRVEVRLDELDAGAVWCFHPNTGAFVARAVDPARADIPRAELAARVTARQKQFVREGVRELRAAAKRAHNRDTAAAEIQGGAGARPPSGGTPPGGGPGSRADERDARVIPLPARLETPEVAAALAATGWGTPSAPPSMTDEDLADSDAFDEVARGLAPISSIDQWEE